MQLTKCHVQDFGKLHDVTLDFKSGLNTINQPNGWGKSTLADFVKAILFGLNTTTKRDLDQNDRLKYLPWNKTKFGGYLEFVLNNKAYRLERWFGAKQNQDSATLYDLSTNNIAQDYSPNIMEEYFGINADTFERSTYISQGQLNAELGDSVKARLGNLLQNENESNFERAQELVNERRKEKQLYRGKGGEIEEVRAQIENENLKLSNALNKKLELESKQKEYDEQKIQIVQKQHQLAELEKQISALEKAHAKNAEIEHYESLKQNLERIKNEYSKDLAFFKGQPLDYATTQDIQNQINTYNEKQALLNGLVNDIDNTELEYLQNFFKMHIPTETELDDYASKCAQIDKLEKQLDTMVTPNILSESIPQKTKNYSIYFVLLGIVTLVLGLCLGVVANWIVGSIIMVLGFGCGVFGGITWHNNQQKQQALLTHQKIDNQRKSDEFDKNQQRLQSEIDGLKSQLNNFLQMFLTPTSSPLYDLSNIRSKKDNLNTLKKREAQYQQNKANLTKDVGLVKNALDKFFNQYFDDTNSGYQHMLNIIEQKLNDLERLDKEKIQSYQTLQTYIQQKGIDEQQKITQTDIDKVKTLNEQKIILSDELKNLNTSHGQTLAIIKSLSTEVDNIGAYEQEIATLKERESNIIYEVKVLDNVLHFLKSANEALTSKYLSPITKSFLHYANLLSNNRLNTVSINTDLDVQFEAEGAKRDKKYLSAGYRDIVDLCMRFALVDAIFPSEKPIVILDDPFINLDEQNTHNGLELIKNISKERQIIYFACHPSRVY